MTIMIKLVLLLGLSLILSIRSHADDYPSRSIRAIASQSPGGLSDVFMRGLGKELSTALGQPVTVENRVGANGTIGTRACASAEPDGYTFCILNDEPILFNPLAFPAADFDPLTKLVPITRLFNVQQVFAVAGSLNVTSFDGLIALAKKNPKTMNYMAPSITMVAFMEELNRKHGTDFTRIPFRGGSDAVSSMLSGATQIAVIGISNFAQLISAGKVVGLAVDGEQRSPLVLSIPTFKEAGYSIEISSYFGLYSPVGTPKAVIEKLYSETRKILLTPEFQARHMAPNGLSAVANSPEEFAKEVMAGRAAAVRAVKNSGLYPHMK